MTALKEPPLPFSFGTMLRMQLIQTRRLDGFLRLVTPLEYQAQETMADAARYILQKHPGVTLQLVRSYARPRELVHIRIELVLHFREVLGKTFPEIGRFMRRDHSSIHYLYYKAKAAKDGSV